MAFSLRARPFIHKLSAACHGRQNDECRFTDKSAKEAGKGAQFEDRENTERTVDSTYFFVRGKDCKPGAGRLVLIGSS